MNDIHNCRGKEQTRNNEPWWLRIAIQTLFSSL